MSATAPGATRPGEFLSAYRQYPVYTRQRQAPVARLDRALVTQRYRRPNRTPQSGRVQALIVGHVANVERQDVLERLLGVERLVKGMPETAEATLMTLSGQILGQGVGLKTFDMSSLENGLYLLQVIMDGESQVFKIVKK